MTDSLLCCCIRGKSFLTSRSRFLFQSVSHLSQDEAFAMHLPNVLMAVVWAVLAAATNLKVSVLVEETIESDWTTTYYSKDIPLLLGNDGGASTGGFHAWRIGGGEPLEASVNVFTGRTKLVSTLYNVCGKDYLASIPQTTSRLTLYELPDVTKVEQVEYFALGDWSALCSWKSRSKNDYLYLFGKREAVQFLVRSDEEQNLEIIRVRQNHAR